MTENGEAAATRAYRILERMIVTLALEPGGVTTEGALIARIGLGRTPVREAIQRLAWEGLIAIRPRAGLAVAPLDPADWLKVLDARRGPEMVLARAAALSAEPEHRGRLRDAEAAMRNAASDDDLDAYLAADKALDEAIAEAADNRFAAILVAPLQTHSRRFWFRYRADAGIADAARSHLAVISAILEGNADEAESEAGRLIDLLREAAVAGVDHPPSVSASPSHLPPTS